MTSLRGWGSQTRRSVELDGGSKQRVFPFIERAFGRQGEAARQCWEREYMEEMTTLNKVDDFENLSSSAPRTHGGAASVAHPLIRPIPNGELNKFKMASLIWYEYERYLQYVSTEMKNVKAIEDAGLITPTQNKQMREHQ
ncbi:MAG: hypothetical protein J3Q66DRAFT_434296 [Benniella sp.]|nr:MAG: hypothetical protein J3Q66DRAFT_434296 [Benniella sp.]